MNIIGLLVLASVGLSSYGGVVALCNTPHCPPPWRAFQGHCYLLVDTPMPWMDAERHCQMLSHPGKMVHIASIHSNEEDEFIGEYVQESETSPPSLHWIGFNDHASEGDFNWTDGSEASYTHWATNEPNDWLYQEDCAVQNHRLVNWNDDNCLKSYPFICKK